MKKMLLVDGNSMIFRAYYATAYGRVMTTSNGIHTNAVYGFNMMLNKALELVQPDAVFVAFDTGKKTFRHELYKDYKGGRKETPEDLIVQFPIVRELLDAMHITRYELEGKEADDLIGSMAKKYPDWDINILSSDRDLLQLIDETTSVWLMKKGLSEIEEMTMESLKESYGLTPSQIIDLKGLMGDTSDNIPGIPGIGEKTALKLLNEYGTVENLLEHSDTLKGKLKEKVENNKELARLSKQLATIDCTVDVQIDPKTMTYLTDGIDLYHFYEKYEMKSLSNKISFTPSEIIVKDVDTGTTTVNKVPSELLKEDIAVYIDSDLEQYRFAHIYGFGLSDNNTTIYITIEDALKDESFLNWLNSTKRKIVYDLKATYALCHYASIPIDGLHFDVKLAAFLIDTFVDKWDKLYEKYHLSTPDLRTEIYGSAGKMKLPDVEEQIQYVTKCAKDIASLYQPLKEELAQLNMVQLYEEIEHPLSFVLFDMEQQGIRVDLNILNEIAEKTLVLLQEYAKKIYGYANREFNINSPKQLAEILFDELGLPSNKKRSTAVDILEKLKDSHPIIEELISYRKYQKLYSTYAEGLKKYVGSDHKIHTIYNQTITQTGRLSSTEPNLQNISVRTEEGREIRKAFIPEENCVLVSCDYSQVELRVLAHMANETKLIDAFNHNIDIHTATAAEVFGVKKEEVTSEMRRQAKAVNFGVVYGISDFGLAEQLSISRKTAQEFINRYFESYPRIKEYMNEVIEFCKETGYVETLCHRRRYIPEIHDKNHMIREFGKRAAMNAPVQGTAADLIKIAMVKIDKRIKSEGLQSRMILQVHDELVFNVLKEEESYMCRLMEEEMENAMHLNVPLASNRAVGNNWYDAK